MIDRGSFIRLTALAGVAAGSALPRSALASADEPLRFDFRSTFWENLHHRLYFQAQAYDYVQHGNALDPKKYVWDAIATDALEEYRRLSPEQRSVWEASMNAYVKYGYTNQDLLEDSMAAIDTVLMDIPENAAPMPGPLRRGLVGALTAAAPVYRATLWETDDTANRAWIAKVSPSVERYTQRLTNRLRQVYQTKWPLGPYRVDVSSYSNFAGFYTNVDPVHTIASPRDMRNNTTLTVIPNRGTTALEIIFHEASHSVVTPGYGSIGAAIQDAATALKVAEPEGLWHAVVFYTVGRVVADAVNQDGGETYEMIADSLDVYANGWTGYRKALLDHWQPYLDGKSDSLADSLHDVVAAASARA